MSDRYTLGTIPVTDESVLSNNQVLVAGSVTQ